MDGKKEEESESPGMKGQLKQRTSGCWFSADAKRRRQSSHSLSLSSWEARTETSPGIPARVKNPRVRGLFLEGMLLRLDSSSLGTERSQQG